MRCCVSGNSSFVLASLMQRAMNALFDSSVFGVGNGICLFCFVYFSKLPSEFIDKVTYARCTSTWLLMLLGNLAIPIIQNLHIILLYLVCFVYSIYKLI